MFDYVISPLTRDSFLADFWGRSFLHRPGNPGKFASLLPWSELNGVLEQHELEPPRFRLFQDGKAVDQARFTSILDGARRLRSRDFVQCLAKGATLIVDRMDELSPSVRRLAEAFEDVLRAPTCVNLYAGWRTQKGLDLHWDSQDTLILQISGRKHWRVYAPTRLHPLRADVGKVPTPTAQPVWDSILADGDAIYLPRGWWHVAFPVNEPSLHLTVTVLPSHGVDVLEWLVRRLQRHDEVRANAPLVGSASQRTRYLSRLQELVTMALHDADLLERFQQEWEARIPLRARVRLPFAPTEQLAPIITMDTHIRLATTWRLVFHAPIDDGKVRFAAGAVEAECDAELVPALKHLSATAPCSVRELCTHLPNEESARRLKTLLAVLALQGSIWTEQSSDPDDGRRVGVEP